MAVTQFYLFTTSGCHLCEQAEALLRVELPATHTLKLEEISNSDALMQRYGVRIPVLGAYCSAGQWQELGWPFGTAEIAVFINRCSS